MCFFASIPASIPVGLLPVKILFHYVTPRSTTLDAIETIKVELTERFPSIGHNGANNPTSCDYSPSRSVGISLPPVLSPYKEMQIC